MMFEEIFKNKGIAPSVIAKIIEKYPALKLIPYEHIPAGLKEVAEAELSKLTVPVMQMLSDYLYECTSPDGTVFNLELDRECQFKDLKGFITMPYKGILYMCKITHGDKFIIQGCAMPNAD